jgi:hypothetical protein
LALNGLLNVWAEPRAVGARRGKIGVPLINYTEPNNFGGVKLVAQSPEMIEMIALDDTPYMPNFIKIDVEGMELDVILGASNKIEACRPTIYCENDRPETMSALIQALLDRSYDIWWHIAPLFNDKNWRGNANNIYQSISSVNMLCVPAEIKAQIGGLRKVSGPKDTVKVVPPRQLYT